MLQVELGDLLQVRTGIICQQVNCQGVMGKGLALAIKQHYPVVEQQYKEFCSRYKTFQLLGRCQIVKATADLYVANVFGQLFYARSRNDKTVYTDYGALRQGLVQVKEFAQLNDLQVYLPLGIGCGLANGNWAIVSSMIAEVMPAAIIVKKE